MRRFLPYLWAFLPVAMALMSGCGRDYELNIEFKSGTPPSEGSGVYVDDQQVGHVAAVASRGAKGFIVRAVIEDDDVVETRIKRGIMPYVHEDVLKIDASHVKESDPPLPSGSTVLGSHVATVIFKRYAVMPTVFAHLAAYLIGGVIIWIFRKMFHLAGIVACLVVSFGIALACHAPLVPAVEAVYDAFPQAQAVETEGGEGGAGEVSGIGDKPADGGEVDLVKKPEDISELTRLVRRPKPKTVAFLGLWLTAFIAIQVVLGVLFRPFRRRKA